MLCALTIFFSAMMTTFVCKKNDIKSHFFISENNNITINKERHLPPLLRGARSLR